MKKRNKINKNRDGERWGKAEGRDSSKELEFT
jgi:hypothetical protein